jgi:hypothetical protein
MPTTITHNINIDDDIANWLRWGNLVLSWVNKTTPLPATVGTTNSTDLTTLYGQMNAKGVNGKVKGASSRGVTFIEYPVDGAIVIPLPNADMVDIDNKFLRQLAHNGSTPVPYPLQSFYAACFGGAAQVNFSLQELLNMEARRIGEYVINECM